MVMVMAVSILLVVRLTEKHKLHGMCCTGGMDTRGVGSDVDKRGVGYPGRDEVRHSR